MFAILKCKNLCTFSLQNTLKSGLTIDCYYTTFSGRENFDLEFEGKETDFVRVENLKHELDQFTISLWVKTTINDKGYFTYTTTAQIKTILLREHDNKMHFEIFGTKVEDVFPNVKDGNWHHILINWENVYGKVNIYGDGVLLIGKADVRKQITISKTGLFYLGQEIKSVDGSSRGKSYIGMMTEFHLWNYVLSDSEFDIVSKTCHSNMEGNVISWYRDILPGIEGDVDIHRPSTCA